MKVNGELFGDLCVNFDLYIYPVQNDSEWGHEMLKFDVDHETYPG